MSLCFFCNDFIFDQIVLVNISGEEVNCCTYNCLDSLIENLMSYIIDDKIHTLSFKAQKKEKIKTFPTLDSLGNYELTEIIISNEKGEQINRFEISCETEAKNKLKKLVVNDFREYHFNQIDPQYLASIVRSLKNNLKNIKNQIKRFQSLTTKNLEWSPDQNKLFPLKQRKKIFPFLLSLRVISDFTKKWANPVKIPKFVVHQIISYL